MTSAHRVDRASGTCLVESLLARLETLHGVVDPEKYFVLLLIDGLSMREEQVTRALQHSLETIPLIGGSAGDGLKFSRTHVYHDMRAWRCAGGSRGSAALFAFR